MTTTDSATLGHAMPVRTRTPSQRAALYSHRVLISLSQPAWSLPSGTVLTCSYPAPPRPYAAPRVLILRRASYDACCL